MLFPQKPRFVLVSIYALMLVFLANRLFRPLYSSSPKPFPSKSSFGTTIPLEMRTSASNSSHVELKLDIMGGAKLFRDAQQFSIQVATYGKTVNINRIELRDESTQAVLFEGRDPAHEDNQPIHLFKTPSNQVSEGSSAKFSIIALVPPGTKLAVWAKGTTLSGTADLGEILIPLSHESFSIFGTWSAQVERTKIVRLQALNYMWDGMPISKNLAAASLGLVAAIYFLLASAKWSPFWGATAFFSFCLFYGSIIPPFQAPDEPDHFLNFTELKPSPNLAASALELARRGHLESIKFNPENYFSAEEFGHPSPAEWGSHIGSPGNLETRSPIAGTVWPIMSVAIDDSNAAKALMSLRFFNAIMTSLGVALFIFLAPSQIRILTTALLLTIPTLPFFGLHWSNHSFITAFAIGGCGFIFRWLSGARLTAKHYLTWGIIAGLCFVSGIPGTALWLFFAMLVAIVLISERNPYNALINSALFALSSEFLIFILSGKAYVEAPLKMLGHVGMFNWLIRDSNGFSLIMGVGQLAFVGLTTALAFSFQKIARRRVFAGTTHKRQFVLMAMGLWALFLGWTAVRSPTFLPNIEYTDHGLSPISYGWKAIKLFFAGLGLGPNDWYLTQTFWGGFGWLDTMPPQWFIRLMRLWPTIGIILILAAALRGRGTREFWKLVVASLPLAFFIFILAAGAINMPANLHGRYLIGVYLATLTLSWTGFTTLLVRLSATSRSRLTATIFLIVLATHGYSLAHILARYFGAGS